MSFWDGEWRLFLRGNETCTHFNCKLVCIYNGIVAVEEEGHKYLYPLDTVSSLDSLVPNYPEEEEK